MGAFSIIFFMAQFIEQSRGFFLIFKDSIMDCHVYLVATQSVW